MIETKWLRGTASHAAEVIEDVVKLATAQAVPNLHWRFLVLGGSRKSMAGLRSPDPRERRNRGRPRSDLGAVFPSDDSNQRTVVLARLDEDLQRHHREAQDWMSAYFDPPRLDRYCVRQIGWASVPERQYEVAMWEIVGARGRRPRAP